MKKSIHISKGAVQLITDRTKGEEVNWSRAINIIIDRYGDMISAGLQEVAAVLDLSDWEILYGVYGELRDKEESGANSRVNAEGLAALLVAGIVERDNTGELLALMRRFTLVDRLAIIDTLERYHAMPDQDRRGFAQDIQRLTCIR